MKQRIVLCGAILILLVTSSFVVAAEGEQRIFPYDSRVEVLDNGLKTIVIPMSSGGLVAIWSVVRTGSRDEYEPGKTGFAHFFEHMMFRGTESYPADEYNRLITRMGADANAYTTDDLTAYHMGIAVEDLELALQLESDRFRHLSYARPEFETEAGAVYGEYRKNRTNPFFSLYEMLYAEAFRSHTYGHTTMGHERDIKGMPELYDYSRSFFERYYRPDNVVLMVVGDVEPAKTLELVRRYYGDWKSGYVAPNIPKEPVQTEGRSVEVEYDGKSLPILWMVYKSGKFDPKDRSYVAASLLVELAFGETSEAHRELVLEKQLVEFIVGDQGATRDPGVIDIYTRIKDPEQIGEVRRAIEATVERYRTERPDARRLADLKARLRYGFLMGLDTPDRVASALARTVAITGGIDAVDDLYRTIDQVTADDVLAAAQRFLVPEQRTVGVLQGSN